MVTLRFKGVNLLVLVGIVFSAGCSGGGSGEDISLPMSPMPTPSLIENICTTNQNGITNKLGVRRLMRFSVSQSQDITITATRTSGLNSADPDLRLYRNGLLVGLAQAETSNIETLSASVTAGDYVLDLLEYNYTSGGAAAAITCYQVSIQYSAGSSKPLPAPGNNAPTTSVANNTAKASNSTSTCSDAGEITVSGTITYDLVTHNPKTSGLNYATGTSQEPVKGAVVEMICAGAMYDTAVTDANGNYSLTASVSENNFVRVYAQMLDTNAPATWNFQVVDNTNSGALYALDGPTINSATDVGGHDLNAASGWGGSSYTTPRAAAPFAILDSAYRAFQTVLAVAPNSVFPALNINWSINNITSSGDRAAGQITASHYDGTAIYILGQANNDLDEYDKHVIIHEWAHYFEDNFSRSDSIGGPHSINELLDIRLAFGEGFGNAYSAIASGDPVYRDAGGFAQSGGFSFDMDANNSCTQPGWYSECSVQVLLYDFNSQINFSAIYNVMVGGQQNTPAVTSIFSFVKSLKDNNASSVNTIDNLLGGQNIDAITDSYGDSELTNNPGSNNQLPVHTNL